MGIDMWPDDATTRVRIVVESIRDPVTTAHVADEAETDVETAHSELTRMADQGLVDRVGSDEWQVRVEALDGDRLLPLDDDSGGE